MVIVAPFCEVIGELQARSVSVGVFKINHHELLVLIDRKEERRFAGRLEAQ